MCNNHPANRGGITKVIEAVRQLRGEAHPKVQVTNCDLPLAHGTGGLLGTRHGSAHAHPGAGVIDMAYRATQDPVRRRARYQPGDEAVLRRLRGRQAACCRPAAPAARRTGIRAASARTASSQNLEWKDASGQGTIYSFSVMKRAEVPYAIAYVTLAEGPTMMTNIVDCDLDTIRIGQKVTLRFVPTEGGPPMPMFTPA